MNVRITIEEMHGDKSEVLHLNVQEVEHAPGRDYKLDRNKAVRFMLANAAECFREEPPRHFG
jgi:hypothetical protein